MIEAELANGASPSHRESLPRAVFTSDTSRISVTGRICGEDLAQAKNRITRDKTKKDKFGLAIPHVHYDDHLNDKRMRNHAFAQGREIYESLGAEKVYEATPFASGHNMGSCRMSERPEDGVCNKWGQTHEIPNLFISDGSQFSTSAAPNPTLTIVALTIRQADYIADQMAKRAM
jgi:choline dehydrogenase-like flavoprotein